jgi:hypothetical protein
MGDVLNAPGEITQHMLELIRVRPRADDTLLCPSKFRSGHRLHSLRQLLRVFYRPDPPPDIQETGHIRLRAPSPP